MRFTPIIRIMSLCLALCFTWPALSGTVYEAARFSGRMSERDIEIAITVDEQRRRVDVSVHGQMRVSLLESGQKMTLIDHVQRVYISGDVAQDVSVPDASPVWRETSRHLFVLGSYCSAVESYWSSEVYQEQCSEEPLDLASTSASRTEPTRIGEFLRLVVATPDVGLLYDRAQRLFAGGRMESTMPFAVRHYESGSLVGELRVTGVAKRYLPAKTFDVPRGLHRVPMDTIVARSARK